jgi:hypothetical protein
MVMIVDDERALVAVAELTLAQIGFKPAGFGSKRPCGLFGKGIRDVADLTIGGSDRMLIRTPGVIGGRAGESHDDESAEHDHAEPEALESDRAGIRWNLVAG